MDDNGRVTGTVQWFSRVKGYGFVRPDTQEEDIFVHYSSIQGEGYRNLDEGQRVEFTVEDTPKGPQAVDIVGLEASENVPAGSVEFEAEAQFSEEVTADSVEFETEVQLSEEVIVDNVEFEAEAQLAETL